MVSKSRRSGWYFLILVSMSLLGGAPLWAQEGEDDAQRMLERAVDLRRVAASTADLDEVARLCEQAIEKGLDATSEELAKNLWASALFDHAANLSGRILEQPTPDRRWQFFRQQALTRLNKVVELSPEMLDAHLLIARLQALPRGDQEAARRAIEKAIELAKDQPAQLAQAHLVRAELATDDAQRREALDAAVEADPENPGPRRMRGAYLLSIGEIDSALEDFKLLSDSDPDDGLSHLLAAEALRGAGRTEEAIERLNQALQAGLQIAGVYTLRAHIHREQEEIEKALEDLKQALTIDPADIDALLLRASIYYEKQRFEDALDDVQTVLRVRSGLVRAIYMRAFIYAGMRQFERAIADIEQLVAFEPDNPQWRIDLAMLLNAADRPRRAIELYTQVLGQDLEESDKVRALRGRGDARLSTGEHEAAIEDYNAALQITPEDPPLVNNLSWVLSTSPLDHLRDGERALELALKAAELTEYGEAYILSTLAAAYAENGDFESAIRWAAKAVELAEDKDRDNLQKELESFQRGEPWREMKQIDETAPDQSDN